MPACRLLVAVIGKRRLLCLSVARGVIGALMNVVEAEVPIVPSPRSRVSERGWGGGVEERVCERVCV